MAEYGTVRADRRRALAVLSETVRAALARDLDQRVTAPLDGEPRRGNSPPLSTS